jgi:hypothetical protein
MLAVAVVYDGVLIAEVASFVSLDLIIGARRVSGATSS